MNTTTIESLVIQKNFSVSPDKVYQAWTNAEVIGKWFFPNERWVKCEAVTNPVVGGRFNIAITHLDGDVFQMEGEYLELVENEKIVLSWGLVGDSSISKVTLDMHGDANSTSFTLTHSNFASDEEREQTITGWAGCLASLESVLHA